VHPGLEILEGIQQGWSERRLQIVAQANSLTAHLEKSNVFRNLQSVDADFFTASNAQLIANNILQAADTQWGGFGKANLNSLRPLLFDICCNMLFIRAIKLPCSKLLLSIDKMLWGGIYDQVGGGLARYSTDNEWMVPHFEKMLYDNALFITVLSEAYQITHAPQYENAIQQTIEFLEREMYKAGKDIMQHWMPTSEGVEGKFYIWSKAEIVDVLGEAANLFCAFLILKKMAIYPVMNTVGMEKIYCGSQFQNQHLPSAINCLWNNWKRF
jgi:uncharacterized protein YyaL (SSP411 family)